MKGLGDGGWRDGHTETGRVLDCGGNPDLESGHAALARAGRHRIFQLIVRPKAVSRLPPCHRSPKPRGSFPSRSQIVGTVLFNLR